MGHDAQQDLLDRYVFTTSVSHVHDLLLVTLAMVDACKQQMAHGMSAVEAVDMGPDIFDVVKALEAALAQARGLVGSRALIGNEAIAAGELAGVDIVDEEALNPW